MSDNTDTNPEVKSAVQQQEDKVTKMMDEVWDLLWEHIPDNKDARAAVYNKVWAIMRESNKLGQRQPQFDVYWHVNSAIKNIVRWGDVRSAVRELLRLREYGYNESPYEIKLPEELIDWSNQ